MCKKPEESNICPAPLFLGIQNSEPEEPEHDMGQTLPARIRTSDISGILGLLLVIFIKDFFFSNYFPKLLAYNLSIRLVQKNVCSISLDFCPLSK